MPALAETERLMADAEDRSLCAVAKMEEDYNT